MKTQNKQKTVETGETYGTRTCKNCKKEFEAVKPWQITCSAKCAAERRKAVKRKSDALRRQRRKTYLLGLLTELDESVNEISWLNCRYESLICGHAEKSVNNDETTELRVKLKEAEYSIISLEGQLSNLQTDSVQNQSLKESLDKELARNAELLEELAKLKIELAQAIAKNGQEANETQEILANAEKRLGELNTPADTKENPVMPAIESIKKPSLKMPASDGGYEARCDECGAKFWTRDKNEKFCCSDCFLANKKRKDIEEADSKGYPAKKSKKSK